MNPVNGQKRKEWLRMRIGLVGVVFALVFAGLLVRSFQLAVFKGPWLRQRALDEIVIQDKINPRRGIIYDRNQEELAVSLDTDSVCAYPVHVEDFRHAAKQLAKALNLPASKVRERLESGRNFTWIARRVSPQQAARVRSLDLKGIRLLPETRRFYPYSTLACHVLGYVGMDAKGWGGLELRYDTLLRGTGTKVTRTRDALGRTVALAGGGAPLLPEGSHLILTLDKGLQYKVETILAEAVTRAKAKGGQAVVLMPDTGEILAMAAYPAFNPNVYTRFPPAVRRNSLVSDFYEPGSTFKVFTAAAALKSNRVTLSQQFDCEEGSWRIGPNTIRDTHPHQMLDLAGIVQVSSNIGAAKVGLEVGARNLWQTLRDFGFGRPTGITLPAETSGILRRPKSWQPVDLANICFGQGVAVTSLQLAAAFAAIANGGLYMKPFVVRAVARPDGSLIKENSPEFVSRPLSPRQARLLTDMMIKVTQPGGTGTRAAVPPYLVAGKTGTAQKISEGGGYSNSKFVASFVGFLPADDPKAVILVSVDEPKGQHFGGQVAGPAFAAIAREALASLGVSSSSLVAQVGGAPKSDLPVPRPRQSPLAAYRELDGGRVPDFGGFTLRQVLRLTAGRDINLKVQGWGRVVEQSPAPGDKFSRAAALSVRLAPAGGGA